MVKKAAISALVWAAFTLSALSALFLSFVLTDGEGFLGPYMVASVLIGLTALVLAAVGVARSQRLWPGLIAVFVSGLLGLLFPVVLIGLLVFAAVTR